MISRLFFQMSFPLMAFFPLFPLSPYHVSFRWLFNCGINPSSSSQLRRWHIVQTFSQIDDESQAKIL